MKTKRVITRHRFTAAICAGVSLLLTAAINVPAQYNYTILSAPGSVDTYGEGISGNDIVGFYDNRSGPYTFLYNISAGTYTTINSPGLGMGISGNDVVGTTSSSQVGFLYDINSGTHFTYGPPGASSGAGTGLSGNNIVGWYQGSGPVYGFIYNTNTSAYTRLSVSGNYTWAYGISGNEVVGTYNNGSAFLGYLYNISSGVYTTFSVPGAGDTWAYGVSGNNIVGYDSNGDGFLYNISSGVYTTFDVPGAQGTYAQGVDGNNIVGYYYNGSDYIGFLAIPVPEPSVFALLVAGATAFLVSYLRKAAV
jgi:hypothetical protein